MKRLNISIDDVSPHSLSNIDVIDNCQSIIDKHPNVKFTLFVPTAYWRTMKTGNIDTTTPHPLFLVDYPDFCFKLRSLNPKNFEIGYHGRYHGIPQISNNNEVEKISKNEFIKLYDEMKNDLIVAIDDDGKFNALVKNIFRPPGMYMSPAAITAADELKLQLALSNFSYHKASYKKADEKLSNVVYANIWPPNNDINCDTSNMKYIEILYHACMWDKGYLSSAVAQNIIAWLDYNQFEYSFIDELLEK